MRPNQSKIIWFALLTGSDHAVAEIWLKKYKWKSKVARDAYREHLRKKQHEQS